MPCLHYCPMQALALPSCGPLDPPQLLNCSGTGYVRERLNSPSELPRARTHHMQLRTFKLLPLPFPSLLEQTNMATANWSPWRVKTFSIHTPFNSSIHCAVCWPFYCFAFYFTTSDYVPVIAWSAVYLAAPSVRQSPQTWHRRTGFCRSNLMMGS